jgi:hypothetical protein
MNGIYVVVIIDSFSKWIKTRVSSFLIERKWLTKYSSFDEKQFFFKSIRMIDCE